MTAAGLPHSGTPGSQPACGSPGTIAACRALLRLSVPRHPPCALSSLGRIVSGPTRKPAYPVSRTGAHVRHTIGADLFLLPFPYPSCQSNRYIEECFALFSPRFQESGRSASRAFVREQSCSKAWPRVTRRSKGGDPAAGSPTATLLRLRPSHRARLRRLPPRRVGSPTSGAPDFHGVTGGVYKARERIHRGVADPRLLAIPASRSRVADCDPNLDRVSPIRSPSRVCSGLSRPL